MGTTYAPWAPDEGKGKKSENYHQKLCDRILRHYK